MPGYKKKANHLLALTVFSISGWVRRSEFYCLEERNSASSGLEERILH